MLKRDAERIFGYVDVDAEPRRGTGRRPSAGRTSVESYLASRIGPLAYMVRLRRIEEGLSRHERDLRSAWRNLAVECRSSAEAFDRRWRELAKRRSFRRVNDLIAEHNRWYPAEARLRMDPRTGDFVSVDGRSYGRRPLEARWVLERFPPDLAAALRE